MYLYLHTFYQNTMSVDPIKVDYRIHKIGYQHGVREGTDAMGCNDNTWGINFKNGKVYIDMDLSADQFLTLIILTP